MEDLARLGAVGLVQPAAFGFFEPHLHQVHAGGLPEPFGGLAHHGTTSTFRAQIFSRG